MKKTILLFSLLFIAYCDRAQTSISAYLSAPFPTNLISSGDGKTIAWVFNDKGSRNIYSADADGNNVKRVTNYSGDDGMDLGDLQLTPTGAQVIYVRGNPPNNHGETANPAFLQTSTERVVYLIEISNGNPKKISNGFSPRISPDGKHVAFISGAQIWLTSLTDTSVKPEKLFQSRGTQSNIQWSPDGQAIAFVSNREDHSFVGIYQLGNKMVKFVESSIDFDLSPAWSPDGEKLAYLRIPNMHNQLTLFTPVRESNPWSIRIYDIKSTSVAEVWKASRGEGSYLFNVPLDGNNLLWWGSDRQLIFPYEKDGWIHLYELEENNRLPRLLTPGNGEVMSVALTADRQMVYYGTNIGDIDRRQIFRLNIASGKSTQLTKGNNIEWSPIPTASGIAYLHSSATRPAWPAIWQNDASKDIATELFPKDFPSDLLQPKAFTITASDGIKTHAQIFLPPHYNSSKKYPALIFLHGGSKRQMLLGFHYLSYYSNAYALNQYFAGKGYIVLALNYRSGIGYGLNFREALNYGSAGASEVKDLLAAGSYLQGRPDVDTHKIALWGGSYGGYLTAHGLSQAPNVFAAGVAIHGVYNWNDELPTFYPWYDYAKFPEMAKTALRSSPVYYVKNWKAPVLLIHGDDDRNVPFSESVDFAELLRKQNVHVEQLVFPDEIHGFMLHSSWIKAYEATFEFINRQMKVNN